MRNAALFLLAFALGVIVAPIVVLLLFAIADFALAW